MRRGRSLHRQSIDHDGSVMLFVAAARTSTRGSNDEASQVRSEDELDRRAHQDCNKNGDQLTYCSHFALSLKTQDAVCAEKAGDCVGMDTEFWANRNTR